MAGDDISYGAYLQLDRLLTSQSPRSDAHDEMLFIIQHQPTELWMRLLLYEIEAARAALMARDFAPAFLMPVILPGTRLHLGAVFAVLAALALRMTGIRPPLYRQARIGRHGRPFDLYKLRTMRSSGGAQVTVAGDQRVGRLARVVRRWKIDELPQLWNVLRGDMRLIGPRPEVERFVRQYTGAQLRILDVLPGIASMSQLVYPHEPELLRDAIDPEAVYVRELMPLKIAVDLEYERTRSATTDARLLLEIGLLVLGWRTRHPRSRHALHAPTLQGGRGL